MSIDESEERGIRLNEGSGHGRNLNNRQSSLFSLSHYGGDEQRNLIEENKAHI